MGFSDSSELLIYLKMLSDTKGGEAVRAELEALIAKEQEQATLQAAARDTLRQIHEGQREAAAAISATGAATSETDVKLTALMQTLSGLRGAANGSLMSIRQLMSGITGLQGASSALAGSLSGVGALFAGVAVGRALDNWLGISDAIAESVSGLDRARAAAVGYHEQLVRIREKMREINAEQIRSRAGDIEGIGATLADSLGAVRSEAGARHELSGAQSGQRRAEIMAGYDPGEKRERLLAAEQLRAAQEKAKIDADLAADEKAAAVKARDQAQRKLDEIKIGDDTQTFTPEQKADRDKQLQTLRETYREATRAITGADQRAKLAGIGGQTAATEFRASDLDIGTRNAAQGAAEIAAAEKRTLQEQLDAKEAELAAVKKLLADVEKDPSKLPQGAAFAKEQGEAAAAQSDVERFRSTREVGGRRVSRSSRAYREEESRLIERANQEAAQRDEVGAAMASSFKQILDMYTSLVAQVNNLTGQIKNLPQAGG
jgi:hypothetical protein